MLLIISIFLLCIVIGVLTFFRDIVVSLLNAFFGLFRRNGRNSGRTGESARVNRPQTDTGTEKKKGKVISKDDGEYVDFEEIK
ncbi:MAG: DUF4834 family protein [Bacteroidaceae bacterium]|nr:DUF4834 family protein [Bacteroidaceae bacterium]